MSTKPRIENPRNKPTQRITLAQKKYRIFPGGEEREREKERKRAVAFKGSTKFLIETNVWMEHSTEA